MSSYYNRVVGTLSPSEIARSEDIHTIQSSITTALQSMLIDLLGTGCILGDDEDDLKLIPTPYTIDQTNTDFNEENPWISFSDTYLRQSIDTEMSEIQAIRVTIQNNTNLMPTVFAEIRDANFNLIKETNTKLPAQTDDDGQQVDFIFDLQHLPKDTYYFVIRPIDINAADLTANGDETQYDTITEDSFQILCDRNGNYNQGLYASYNGVDYLEARLLESELKDVRGDFIEVEDENFDLCFEHIFSSGNTYLIDTTVPCIVLGEKIYPIDTHVSLDGPSPSGNRIDLVTLDTIGQLNVTQGVAFVGDPTEKDYPINNTEFAIAYITTYYGSEKAPLIEQDDTNGITRRRDILERIRRLEKKIDYQTEYNSPSRIKYNCTVDPVIKVDQYPPEGTYGVQTTTNSKGEKIVISGDGTNTADYKWSIADASYTYKTATEVHATIYCKNLQVPKTKPDKTKLNKNKHYIKIDAIDDSKKVPLAGLVFKIKIKDNKTGKQLGKTIEKTMNSDGVIYIDPWSLGLTADKTYKVETIYSTKYKMTSYVRIYSKKKNPNFKITNHHMTIRLLDGGLEQNTVDISSDTFTGDIGLDAEKIEIDTKNGEAFLKKINTKDEKVTTFPSASLKGIEYTDHNYIIHTNKKSLQSEYPMFSITLERDCYLQDVTFYVRGTDNIKTMRALLFHNDRIFNLNTSRKNYRKYLKYNDAKDTAFANVKRSDKITIKDKKPFYYTMTVNKYLKKGTYSLVLYGYLNNTKKDGFIKIRERHTPKATQYGVLSKVKGTSTPNQIFIGGESLTNRTMYVKFHKIDDVHNSTGTLISKIVQAKDNIISCKLSHYYDIPNGCYIHTYVSNNGGKTWVEQINNSGKITFNGYGRELRWKIVMTGNGKTSPKLKFNKKKGYAFKITVTTGHKLDAYEDYDRCFATPILNANAITRLLVANNNIQSAFSEWEYARLWMETDDIDITDIDICFAYAYNNYTTAVGTKIENWDKNIFFSQVFASLQPEDFTKTSVDYNNYDADVETDELNFRFKLETDYMYNLTRTGEVIASPDDIGNYSYGDISSEDINMDMFTYGLMDVETVYQDNIDDNNDIVLAYGPYYQAMYHPLEHSSETTIIDNEEEDEETNEEETIPTETVDNTSFMAWASDSDPDYHDGCIVGIKFNDGLTIEEKYTSLNVGIFPNLRDCTETNIETGELKITNGEVERLGTQVSSKYYTENDEAYIKGGTLELVLAFNPYGLVEDNNLTYGKVIPITKDLISCKYQTVGVNLADLYNTTIYSIGIRVSKDAKYTTVDNVEKHPSLQDGDIIGIGNITFGAYNIRPYVPYGSERKKWTKVNAPNSTVEYSNDYRNSANFDIKDAKGNLFKINTDLNLTPYDYVNVQYTVPNQYGEIHKGDILIDLYDTTNINAVEPIETLALPAWGFVQQNSTVTDKTVNAWFKIRTKATSVKCVVLRRENPTQSSSDELLLKIMNILFYNTPQLPALGPQMQIRIYPREKNGAYNTKIRKFGGIYRLR